VEPCKSNPSSNDAVISPSVGVSVSMSSSNLNTDAIISVIRMRKSILSNDFVARIPAGNLISGTCDKANLRSASVAPLIVATFSLLFTRNRLSVSSSSETLSSPFLKGAQSSFTRSTSAFVKDSPTANVYG
jgi:hypothetical protein